LLVGGSSATFDAAPYKAALTRGDMVAERVVFPPLALGYAETHLAEKYRPPTWTPGSELDADGNYVRGYRKPKRDPITGYLPPATPVEVRRGEPPVNAPWRHAAGTDTLGRDFLVRMLWGGRVSLAVGILSAFLLTVIGVLVGSVAGYFGGRVDMAIMRVIEILQSLPAMFLILLAMAFTDPEVVPPIISIVVVIALIRWTGAARLVRGEFFRLREQEFVVAARALGFSSRRLIFRHVLPNALSPVLVSAAFAVAAGILTESVVSFLGFGIQHPGASWGSLVNESRSPEHWWIQVFPGLLIFLTVTCYNLVGDAVRDALDPKLKV
jgi:peptide/nickel transport system permease protein